MTSQASCPTSFHHVLSLPPRLHPEHLVGLKAHSHDFRGLIYLQFLSDPALVLLGLQFRGRRKSKARAGLDRTSGLTVDQKLELVQKELEDTREEIRHMRANAERDLQHHEVLAPPWAAPLHLGGVTSCWSLKRNPRIFKFVSI